MRAVWSNPFLDLMDFCALRQWCYKFFCGRGRDDSGTSRIWEFAERIQSFLVIFWKKKVCFLFLFLHSSDHYLKSISWNTRLINLSNILYNFVDELATILATQKESCLLPLQWQTSFVYVTFLISACFIIYLARSRSQPFLYCECVFVLL